VTSEKVGDGLRPTNPSHAFIRLLENPLADFANVAEQDQQVVGKGVPLVGSDGAEQLGNLIVAEIGALLDGFLKRFEGVPKGFGRAEAVKEGDKTCQLVGGYRKVTPKGKAGKFVQDQKIAFLWAVGLPTDAPIAPTA
jgi:hypothetical protein